MAVFQSLKKIIAIRTYRLSYVVFYHMVFGKRLPFAEKLATVVSAYEKRLKRGDIPVAREVWESISLDDGITWRKSMNSPVTVR